MRKAFLVIALVAASFAGGAAVNGPGLIWVKGLVSSRLHQGDAIPTLDVDAPPGAQDESAPEAATPEAIPSAPPPLLGADLAKAATPPTDEPKPAAEPEASPVAEPPAEEPKPVAEPPPKAPEPPSDSSPPPLSSPADPPTMPRPRAGGWSDAPGPAPATAVLPGPKVDRDRTTDTAVAAATVPAEPASPSPPPRSDWASFRERMRALGVAKYWVEGEPNGSVTFRCVVPSPGQDAVSQQFEAEGDDELQAAESALRRVALWQATEKLKP